MPQTFELDERLAGIVSQPAKEGDRVEIISREMLTSLDGAVLTWHLEALHQALFSRIPNLLSPSQIDHLLVVIAPDLSATILGPSSRSKHWR